MLHAQVSLRWAKHVPRAHDKEHSCQPSAPTPWFCHGFPTPTRQLGIVRWCRSRRHPPAWKAKASPSGAPSPASTWPPWTRSCTWTRWARSTTPPASPRGTPWHPHRGFETVTYMIDGIFQHQDSNGGGSDGDTQWMTAGAGLIIEQSWIAPLTCTYDRFRLVC